jgi:hypothetical protein
MADPPDPRWSRIRVVHAADDDLHPHDAADKTLYSIAVDRYVFRSIPVDKFRYPRFGAVDRDPEKVAWSDLVEDEEFITDVRNIVEG